MSLDGHLCKSTAGHLRDYGFYCVEKQSHQRFPDRKDTVYAMFQKDL